MDAPSVDVLLDIDREYREKDRDGRPWLPVLHTRYGPWRFTALFSNTERARELHRTHDWVVIRFSDPEGEEGRFTVVTERRGTLTGRRVVRGREPECARFYRTLPAPLPAARNLRHPPHPTNERLQ